MPVHSLQSRRRLAAALMVFGITMPRSASAQETVAADDRRTLSQAIALAGPSARGLPIELAASPHQSASPGVEAWTVYGDDGQPRQILVYTRSAAFRCANRHPNPEWQCRLKLASIIVHETWHLKRGRDEEGAYEEQRAFLILNRASPEVIAGVGRSRDVVVARQRRSARTARKESATDMCDLAPHDGLLDARHGSVAGALPIDQDTP